MTLAIDLRAGALARIRLSKDAGDDGSTVAESRTKPADDFAAAVLALWTQLHNGTIDADEYDAEVEAAFDKAIGDVPPDAQSTVEALRQKALARAAAFRESADLDDEDDDFPSEPQRKSWANNVAGAAWGAVLAAGAFRKPDKVLTWKTQDDPHVCEDCDALDGQTFFRSEVEFWPGESDFDEYTQCGPNCRCDCS